MCKTPPNAEIARVSDAQGIVRKFLGYAQSLCGKFSKAVMHRKVLHIAQDLWIEITVQLSGVIAMRTRLQ